MVVKQHAHVVPGEEPASATVAALISESTRAAILSFLMDGTARPAGELARAANVSPQLASNHLRKLLEGGLVRVSTHGRHRYYRLASTEVASTLEQLAVLETGAMPKKLSQVPNDLRYARSCYNHLAGQLGVALLEALLNRGCLAETAEGGLSVPDGQLSCFARLGVDINVLRSAKRPLVRPCLDWSERRFHLAGPLATALLNAWLERRWLVRAHGRRLELTLAGRSALERELGL